MWPKKQKNRNGFSMDFPTKTRRNQVFFLLEKCALHLLGAFGAGGAFLEKEALAGPAGRCVPGLPGAGDGRCARYGLA